jgi:dTDP-4-dehydrorhamnose reductase
VSRVLKRGAPAIVVNSAGYTAVDKAESEVEVARLANVQAVRNLVRALRHRSDTLFVQISSNYVFSSSTVRLIREGDSTNPVNVYGSLKAEAEAVALSSGLRTAVIRTAWLFGDSPTCLPARFLRQMREGQRVVAARDEFGNPSYVTDVAERVIDLSYRMYASNRMSGIFHAVNSGYTSRSGLASHLARISGMAVESVVPCLRSEFQSPAQRPFSAVLTDDASLELGLVPLRAWDVALIEALPALRRAL